jgi:glycerol-3-phosphate acyltransferase PlsY
VVTGLGGLAIAVPTLFIVAVLTGGVTVAVSRYVSLGSLVGTGSAVLGGFIAYLNGYLPLELLIYIVATALVVVMAHAGNIARLRDGTERRLGQPAAPPAA